MTEVRTGDDSSHELENINATCRKIVLIGGGGHCKSVLDTLVNLNLYHDIFVVDQVPVAGLDVFGARYAGDDNVLLELFSDGVSEAFISIGSIKSSEVRQRVCEKARDVGFGFPSIIDSSAYMSEFATVGRGVFIGKKAVVNAGAKVDDFAIINTGSIIEHDCYIGKFSHIAVGATICGNVNIGNDTFVGANATIIQGVKVGMKSVIGAGSIILRDVPDNSRVIGIGGG